MSYSYGACHYITVQSTSFMCEARTFNLAIARPVASHMLEKLRSLGKGETYVLLNSTEITDAQYLQLEKFNPEDA